MTRTTQHTIDRWTAAGRRFVRSRPPAATHYCRDTRAHYQELPLHHPAAYDHGDRRWMRTAHATTPVEQTEAQLARVGRVARHSGRHT